MRGIGVALIISWCGFGHALVAQREPLRDAETMLLVDDREPQPRQRDAFLEQRMGADRNGSRAAFQRFQGLAARLGRQRTGEPRDLDADARQPRLQLPVVLLGQYLGRRHERDLLAALDRLQGGERRDDGLPRADVALQQALHRDPASQVVADLVPDTLLRAGECERNALEKRLRQRPGTGQYRRAPRGTRLAVRLQRQLLREQLVELDARPRRMRALVERLLRSRGQAWRRRVQETHCVAEAPQVAPTQQHLGQHFGAARGIGRERAIDRLAQHVLRQSCRRRIDGRQPVGQRCVLVDDAKLRMDDLRTEIAVAHIAVDADACALRERFLMARIEREEAQRERCVAALGIAQQADELPARAVLDVDIGDHTFGLHRHAGAHPGKRNEAGVILVAQRQVQHEVFLAQHADALELVGQRGGASARRLRRRTRSRAAIHRSIANPAGGIRRV